jgi:predicted permease
VIIGHRLWQRRWGGDPTLVGRTITLSGTAAQVIGIMPPGFEFPLFWVRNPEVWFPFDLSARANDWSGQSLRAFARLKPGITLPAAQAEMNVLMRRLETQFPESSRGLDVIIGPLHEKVVGAVRPALLVLQAGVALVLLITCANIALLLLGRARARQAEIAIRRSLGAGRARLIRQLLTESVLLALLGAVVGLLLARVGLQALLALAPRSLPRIETVALDGTALAATLGLSVVTGILFGLAPALRTSSPGAGRAQPRGDHDRAGGLLVIAQTALALLLLIGAGLMVKSFAQMRALDPGFDPRHVLTVDVALTEARLANPRETPAALELARRGARYREVIEQVRRLPGVAAAGAINHLPIVGDIWSRNFTLPGVAPPAPGHETTAIYRIIAPGYLPAMGMTLQRGRDFGDADGVGAPAVAIVNESFARRTWPGQDPIGQFIVVEDGGPNPRQIVGVVKDVKQRDWTAAPMPEMYLAHLQYPRPAAMTLVVRSAGDAGPLARALTSVIANLDQDRPRPKIVALEQVVSDALGEPRFNLALLNVFAAIALLLAAVGIYGVMAHAVSRRGHEIGIRLALGAQIGSVRRMVVAQGMKLGVMGIALGLLAALAATRWLSSMLFEVSPTDPATFATLAITLTAVALVACYLPARRASRTDPMTALRQD